MRSTRRWFLLVALYMCVIGGPLLVAPHRLPIVFEPNEEVWVRVLGMLLVAMSILQLELSRSGEPFVLRAALLHQAGAVLGLGYLAFAYDSALGRGVLAVVLAVLIGAGTSYLRESKTAAPHAPGPDFVLLPRTARWNLYVTSYTLAYGVLGSLAPLLVFPVIGFPRTDGLWVRAAGCAFLMLSHFNWEVYRAKGSARYILAIYVLRCFILVVLLAMTLAGLPLALLIPAGILGTGVIGTTVSYFPEMRRVKATMTS